VEETVRYRQYAANCVKAAQEATDQTIRASLFDMAQVWLMLADHCELASRTTQRAAAIATARGTGQTRLGPRISPRDPITAYSVRAGFPEAIGRI
jgi:hypothetical protein